MNQPLDLEWDCEPDWDEDEPPRLPPDLAGQRLTAQQFLTMSDIQPTGEYL